MYLNLFIFTHCDLFNFAGDIDDITNIDVRMKYNNQDDSITYFVSYTDESINYSIFEITKNLDIKVTHSNYHSIEYNHELQKAIQVAATIEKDLFENHKEKFISLFDNPSPFVQMILKQKTLDDAAQSFLNRILFKNAKARLLKEQENLLDLNKSTTQVKCDFELSITEFTYNSLYSVSLKVGNTKKYSVKDVKLFLREFDHEENHRFGKYLTLKLCPDSFTERANKLIALLRKNCFDNFYSDYRYERETICEMLFLYQGEVVSFNSSIYRITNEITEASVYIDEKGNLNFDPIIPFKNNDFYPCGKRGFLIDDSKNRIKLFTFENKASSNLYDLGFAMHFDFESVSDLMDNDFTTFVRKAVRTKITNKDDFDLKIKLYISLDLQKNVIFKTEYFYKDQEVERKTLENDFALNNILLEYEVRLEELDLLENGKSKDLATLDKVIIADYSRLKEIAEVYLSEDIMNIKKSKLQKLIIKASSGKDWLSLQVSSDEYSKEELRSILSAYKKKKKFVLLKNNFVSLDNKEALDDLKQLDDNFNLDDNLESNEVPIYQIFNLANLENNQNYEVNYDHKISEIIQSIKNFKTKEISLSDNLLSVLRTYQIDAIKWMKTLYDNKLSGILADDMGLGKSIEFISFRTLINEKAPTLIVCPKSLIYNWRSEFKKWDKSTLCHLIDGNKAQRLSSLEKVKDTNDIVIVSYDSLRSDIEEYKKIHFAIVCLDEAQYIKNSFTLKSKAVKQLDATSRFALTGTPIENALTDLWSIFDFLMPKYLSSEDNFTKEYIDSFNDSDEYAKKRLLAKITPFILRRTKDDVLTDLPPKTTEVISLAMSQKQSELYNAYVLNTKASMDENPKNKLAVLSALTRLRQICVDPSSFLENYLEVSPKLEYAVNLAQNAISGNHKVLIFSQFTSVLEHLQKLLDKENIKWFYICGDTKAQERITIANEFNKSKTVNVILVSLKAGGTGLNLHGADTVLHLDPWWNFAVEDQATDRAHRIGQTRPVTVYKLVAHDSIEERVLELQESKKDLYEQVITNGTQNITSISDEDIKFLLS